MIRLTSFLRPPMAATLLTAGLVAVNSQAADTNARDFFSAPAGTQVGVLYVPSTRAEEYRSSTSTFHDADLSVDALAYRHIWFTDLCGTLCTPQVILSGAHVKARLPGATERQSDTGFGDPQVGGTLYLVNNPEKREYSGLLTLITVPVGSYDEKEADVSAGANRWGATFLLNYTRGVSADWTLEASLEAQLFGDNDDYYGRTLAKDPLYRLQAFASYDFTPSTYGALRLYHARGGELELDGAKLPDTRQRYTQLGLELGHWLDQRNQLMVSVGGNVESENAYHSSQAMLRFAHVY